MRTVRDSNPQPSNREVASRLFPLRSQEFLELFSKLELMYGCGTMDSLVMHARTLLCYLLAAPSNEKQNAKMKILIFR